MNSGNLFKETDEKEHPPYPVIRRWKATPIRHRRRDLFRKWREDSQYKSNFAENWTLQKKVITLKGCPFFKRIEGCLNEVVHLSAPNPEDERLVWIFNHFRFPGPYTTKNCLKVIITPHTVGMYVCFRVKGDFEEAECVIVRIVVQVQKQFGPTQEPGLLLRGLLLMPDGLCSDVDRDGGRPNLCRKCWMRETVFDTPINKPIFVSGKANESKILRIKMCGYAIKQFRLIWLHHLAEYPTNRQSHQISISDSFIGQWYCLAVFVGDSHFQYCSCPFIVHLEEESQEETPLRPPTQQQQQVETRSSVSGASQQVSRRPPPVGDYKFDIVCGSQAEHVPSHADSQSTVSEYSKKLQGALRRILVQFSHQDFRFDHLVRSDSSCHAEIKKILLQLMDKGLADAEFVEELIKTLTWDDTKEPLTEVRQCDQLVYWLIWSLLDERGPYFNRRLAYCLLENLPLPPYVYRWRPSHGCHTYLSKSEVILHVSALNADRLEWRHNGNIICSKDTGVLDHSKLQHTITVCEETCGIYSCVAYNNRSGLTSQSPAFTIDVDYGLPSFAPLGTIRQTPILDEGFVLPPPPISTQPCESHDKYRVYVRIQSNGKNIPSPYVVYHFTSDSVFDCVDSPTTPQNPEDNDIGKLCTGRDSPKPITKRL